MYTQKEHTLPLLQKLDSLFQTINESPYLSRDSRQNFEKKIKELKETITGGGLTVIQGEGTICDLERQVAIQEFEILINKLGQLNPRSPRLDPLRLLLAQLRENILAPEQARRESQKVMNGQKK